ncbi:MAG: hypothetical protein KAV87_14555 [Desulfobacteraceae bacterium]|nr:hypothetical protein [Desulfobacteraceae bacterium]
MIVKSEIRAERLITYCSEIDFGPVTISSKQKGFLDELNHEVISLVRSLPESTQTDALLFLMHYMGIFVGQELNFFKNYYAPSWSTIYWIQDALQGREKLSHGDEKSAMAAHALLLLLHSLDDHFNDNELHATHLSLLVRSQCWLIMNKALKVFAEGVDGGGEIISEIMNDYYSGIRSLKEIDSLDGYCDLFRKQMATGLIVPTLLIKKMSTDEKFLEAMQNLYESFGIAWRLLDDIKDLEVDLKKGSHSSVYIALSKAERALWDSRSTEKKEIHKEFGKAILDAVLKRDVIGRLKERIRNHLTLAASIAADYGMKGMESEFQALRVGI